MMVVRMSLLTFSFVLSFNIHSVAQTLERYQQKGDEQIMCNSFPEDELNRLYNQFDFFRKAGAKEKTINKSKEIVKVLSNLSYSVYKNNTAKIVNIICDFPEVFADAGYKQIAKELAAFVAKGYLATLGEKNPITLDALLALSDYSADLGLWNDAISAASYVVNIVTLDEETYYDQLSEAYYKLSRQYLTVASIKQSGVGHEYDKSYMSAILSYHIRKKYYGEDNLYTLKSQFQVGASLAMMSEDIDEGLSIMKKALSGLERYGEDYYIGLLSNYADALRDNKNYKEALAQELKVYNYLCEKYGEQDNYTLHQMGRLAEFYSDVNDSINAVNIAIKVTNYYIRYIERNFPQLGSREREISLNTEWLHNWFDVRLPIIAHQYNNPIVNYVLFKSILLRKAITNDTYKKGANEDTFLSFCEKIHDAYHDLNKMMSKDDIVIEFISFPCSHRYDNHHDQYSLLYFKKGDKWPHYIPLFTTKDIALYKNSHNGSTEWIYDLLWEPMRMELDGIRNIFISPAGFLNSIPFEYLLNREGEQMSDIYNIYRVSSALKLLDTRIDTLKSKNAVIYGGLNYDVDYRELTQLISHQDMKEKPSLSRGLSDSLIARGGFDFLKNTNEEAEAISNILKRNGYLSILYNGNIGTEESIKSFSGHDIGIVHLATHGMYIPDTEVKYWKGLNNFQFIQEEHYLESDSLNSFEIAKEDNILTRSFLVMSGGNLLAHRTERPVWMDDEILTAQEISELDLSGVDLVVLSACQTGLGDLSNEGVLGLQRGFKKAGANTILMSLDKVDDEATKILMVEFYKNLMAGESKHQSLKDAQRYLRQVDNGKYDDPKYWASFILLDGLN